MVAEALISEPNRRAMAKKESKNGKRFAETFAIFYSEEDKCWVAHGVRTDQFGTGGSVVDALVDGMKAVDQVVALAARKPGIEVFSEAPEEIKQIAKRAKRLPNSILQIVHEKLSGDWPDEVQLQVSHSASFKRKVLERATA
jgi:hypothetical protein